MFKRSNISTRRAAKRSSSARKQNSAVHYERLEPKNLLAAIISEFVASNDSSLIDDNGNSTDWIEIYNSGSQAINLLGYRLTDSPSNSSKFVFDGVHLGAGEFLVVFAGEDENPSFGSDIYTGFSLSAGGEYLALTDFNGNILSEFNPASGDYPEQFTDVSYGVTLSGNFDQASYFATPTPGQPNFGAVQGVLDRVESNVAAGFYDSTIQVTLSTSSPSAQIRYTVDGSTPSETNGSLYASPINVSSTTNLRAVATRANYLSVADGIDQQVLDIEGEQQIRDALLAIPTWSVTTDLDNLFDPQTGIYYNAQQRGSQWERPASVEKIDSGDGTGGFQVNAGLRIKGAFSRRPENPKHSLKLYFRNEYGDADLNYPVHGDEGVDYFKKLDLRTAQNWSWAFNGNDQASFIVDELNRVSQQRLGQPSTLSTWFHLYLNGQYWGLYQTQERHDNNFAASYFGGEPEDYDVIKAENGTAQAADGNLEAYHRLHDQAFATLADGVTPAFADFSNYMRAQGLNADGTRNPNYEVLLDVDNLIAYMMLTLNGGNRDGPIGIYSNPSNSALNNFFLLRNRNADEGFKFFVHDSEHTYRNIGEDRTGPFVHPNLEQARFFNPQTLHQRLMSNSEYRTAFGDAVQEHYFNGGIFTPEGQADLIDELAVELDVAIYAESARWGDAKRSFPQLRQTWLNRLDDLKNYATARYNVILNQYQNTTQLLKNTNGVYNISIDSPIFPSLAAPSYLLDGSFQNGGDANNGSTLTFANEGGVVYYTTDGSDPRLVGGGLNPNAIAFNPGTITETTLFTTGSIWKYHDQGVDLGTSWRASSFNDSAWASGPSQLGYGDGDEATVLSYGSIQNNKHPTTYFRKTFNVADDDYTAATLQVKRDDGIVVYLNGNEIGRQNINGTVSYNSFASTYASDDGNGWHDIVFDPGLLNAGNNTLAVEIHQSSGGSSDISFDARLILTTQSSSAQSVTLNATTEIKSRSIDGGTWSALQAATFVVDAIPATPSTLRVTEINYNPASGSGAEFIELWNSTSGTTAATLDLAGLQLTDGPSSPFVIAAGTTLGPGEYGVLVSDEIAFRAAYPNVDPAIILGEFAGGLSNSGERVRLVAVNGDEIVDVEYNDSDPFPVAADGAGASLVLRDALNTPANLTNKYYSWGSSTTFGGTPGTSDSSPAGVVINEILANSDGLVSDSIELFNPTANPINIGGWFLSDAGGNLLKFQIPAGTVLGAGQYVVFDESDFNPNPTTPAANDFALSASGGDEVYLVIPDGSGGVSEFVDSVEFGASLNNQSFGRIPDSNRLELLEETSFGQPNGSGYVGPVLISEVNYHPEDPSFAALAILPTLEASDLEFVEIHNPGAASVLLTNWRLRGEVDFDFLPGSSIAAGQTILLVSFSPSDTVMASAFRTHYGIGTGVALVGAYSGKLSNSYGRVELEQPGSPPTDNPTLIPRITSDEVLYDDLGPWDPSADGLGNSLARIDVNESSNSPLSWQGSAPTPGTFSVPPPPPFLLGDSNQDGVVDFSDIPAFISILQSGDFLDEADINGDGVVDFADISFFIDLLIAQ